MTEAITHSIYKFRTWFSSKYDDNTSYSQVHYYYTDINNLCLCNMNYYGQSYEVPSYYNAPFVLTIKTTIFKSAGKKKKKKDY